ncbi:hypothetical protein JS528_09550 [Bifidobacterium sp. MA2]|uniref:Phage protein n=1 Tax=Bifidobacterium santillanense TaxID=2809028 RepID=A0ABS5URM8_9BIFI|nr:hypothetical protein [Bifidobacterium santillanense]MBT1173579.1 hypothetical protein [Bifidobacterium santillanense]
MQGEPITLIRRKQHGFTSDGEPQWERTEETVPNVLIQDGNGSNATESTRPDGITVAKTAHFPRTWPYHSLRGCKIAIDGTEYTVIGDPRPYTGGLTPTQWNLTVPLQDERG